MEQSPGPRELLALLAEPDRLRAMAAVAIGAGTLAEVAERAGLEPKAAARALSRLVAGGLLEGGAGKGYRVRAETLRAAARLAGARRF
jgi:DNA-binding IclR family transcriptional regulator